MKTNFKTKLLLGAAVTALSFGVAAGANAQTAVDATVTGDWASDGATIADDGTLAGAAAGADLDISGDGVTVTVTNDNTNDDGSGDTNTFELGDVTDSSDAEDGSLEITTGSSNNLTVTINSVDVNGTVAVTGVDANDGDIDAVITNNLTAGALDITTDAATSDNDTSLTVGGDIVIDGATTLVAANGNGAGGNVVLTVGGNATFTGDLDLDDNGAGEARFILNGGSAQTVTGNITGDGHVIVNNAAGATFNGTIAATSVIVEATAGNASATFTDDVTAEIGLGDDGHAGDENTVNFDTSVNDGFTVTGAITGTADEVDTVNVTGGHTLVHTGGAFGAGELNALNITGTGTVLTSDQNIEVDVTTIGSGATLATTNNTVTSAITNNGTLLLDGGDVTGDITGNGVLTVEDDATLTGNVAGSSATVATGVDLTIAGAHTYSVTNTTLSGTGEFIVGGVAQTISGNILAAEDGEGEVTVSNGAFTTAFTGNIGTADKKIDVFTAGGVAGNTITTTGNLYATTITGHDASTVQFLGSNQTVTGAWTDGILVVGNGTDSTDVTFNDALASLASGTVDENSTARFNDDAEFTGAYTNTGTTHVGAGATVTAGSLTDTGTYVLAVRDIDTTDPLVAADFGSLEKTGGAATLTASNLRIDVQSQLATGTVQLLTNIDAGAATLADNSFQYSFVTATNGVNTDVTVERRSLESIADGSKQTTGVGKTLDGLIDSTNAQIVQINNNLAAAGSQQEVNDILTSVAPNVDAGAVIGATSFITQTSNITNTQLASLRNGEETGMYAGNVTNGLRGWVQGFGLKGDQDARDGVAGYDVDSYGVAVGMDTQSLADGWIWGIAFAYSDTDVDSDGVNNTQTDIDSYQLSLYGSYDLDSRTYIAGQAGYVWGDNTQTRYNVGGAGGPTARADYDSDVVFASLEAGRRYLAGGNTVLTPKALMNYQHYSADGYTETGAGGANLTVSGESLDLFEIGVGVDASWDYQQADGSFLQPKIGVGVRHDLIGDEYQTTSTFAAGGASFQTEGFDPAQTTFNMSAGLTYFSTTNWELSAGYNYEMKSDFDSHAGTLKAAYKF